MFKEFIVRVPIIRTVPPGADKEQEFMNLPQGMFWHEEIGERFEDHAIIRARFAEETPVPIDENYWASISDMLKLNLDLAHAHGLYEERFNYLFNEDLEVVRNRAIKRHRDMATAEIYAVWPEYKQINCALGVYGEAELTACREHIIKCRAKCHAYEAAINQAQTVTELMRITEAKDALPVNATPA